MVVEVTGIGHNRRFKVKWSDDKRTEETVRGLAIPGSAKAKEGKGSERDVMASNLMLVKCEDDTKNDEESEEEDKGNNMKVKTLKKIVGMKTAILVLKRMMGEIQHRKKTDACITVETKDVAKNALCYCVGCSNDEQKIIVPYCGPCISRFCFAKHMKL
ncbi:hypothetical protein EMCRGX_G000570 [Ephydatia muelleri]|eukprot:Em0001g415a